MDGDTAIIGLYESEYQLNNISQYYDEDWSHNQIWTIISQPEIPKFCGHNANGSGSQNADTETTRPVYTHVHNNVTPKCLTSVSMYRNTWLLRVHVLCISSVLTCKCVQLVDVL